MTNHIPIANVTSNLGPAFTLASGDRLYVADGILVAATETLATAVFALGDNLINIDGTVAARYGVGLAGSGNTTLTIGQTGRISAFETGVYSNGSSGFNNVIYNDGSIYGGGVGIQIVFGAIEEIHNSGSIVAGPGTANGINAAITNQDDFATFIENSGLVETRKAGSFSFLSFANVAEDTVVNTGQMIGAIGFGNGNDFYDGALGRLAGRLFGEAGNDTATGGIDNDWFEGGADNDILRGNGGNDRLDGGTGNDSMFGGVGNDTYLVDSANDFVNETGGNGIDTVLSSITFNLGNIARVIGAVENLTLTGTAANGIGNALANTISGNASNNVLSGLGGNDSLLGQGGNDILFGDLGRDISTGGVGNDTFHFTATSQSAVGVNADVITDFDDLGNDTINLAAVYGGVLVYRHNLAFSGTGQVRINDIAGADLLVEVNTGGTLAADMHIRLTATALASMNTVDFLL